MQGSSVLDDAVRNRGAWDGSIRIAGYASHYRLSLDVLNNAVQLWQKGGLTVRNLAARFAVFPRGSVFLVC